MPKLKSENMTNNQKSPLKLVCGDDIRRAQLPVNSSFKILRAVVGTRFPLLKAVLIKYKDSVGDLVTITCSSDLRLAESSDNSNAISKEPSTLRLHIVEVNPEQEPLFLEEIEEEVKAIEVDDEKEVVLEDWLLDFAQIFLTHVGIDPDSHIDLNKFRPELLTKALAEIGTSEEAQTPFHKAASKFQEMAASAFFNWGNVHMCAAQKRMKMIDEAETMDEQAYDCVREEYKKAKRKYKKALSIKSDFFEGLLALGQLQFERAKLLWSFVLAKKTDLSKWDPTETIWLFDSADTNMRAATRMWEKKMEEQRENESGKKDEEAEVMSCQIHLFWGYMLFERYQIEFKLGLPGWDKKLDAAVEKFKLAGPEVMVSCDQISSFKILEEVFPMLPKVILKPSNGYSVPKLKSMDMEDNNQKLHPTKYRPLKLVYEHDIRLAQMPVNSSFEILRDVVRKVFPWLKAVLIKFLDSDGDLVTITCSAELRLAESSLVDDNSNDVISKETGDNDEKRAVSTFSVLRFHIVEVNQEPPSLEEEEEEEEEEIKEPKPKEVVSDDWLFHFSQILPHVGIDPDSHSGLHKSGMDLCSKALTKTVTSHEEAQTLFNKAASLFEDLAAAAFCNWGNLLMWVAQKRMPTWEAQLNNTYDSAREKYTLAKGKYKEALLIKPDFYHPLFGLGRQQFEMAKLHWSFVLAKKSDLSKWDPTETIWLFDSAEKKIRAATKMLEEQRANELGKIDMVSTHFFAGQMLFERSQIECKCGLSGWDKNLDAAVERFELAGVSEQDMSKILKSHFWNFIEGEEG